MTDTRQRFQYVVHVVYVALAAVLAIVPVGCGKPVSLPSLSHMLAPKVEKLPRHPIEELKAIARQRHQYWLIFCTGMAKDWRFQAELCEENCDHATEFIEDGGSHWWSQTGATQEEAAANLIDHPRDHPAEHRPGAGPASPDQCPPEIQGGPND